MGAGYRIEREVRPAGSCRRLVARDLVNGGEVLVKVLPTDLALAIDPDGLERRLLSISSRLEDPRVVKSLAAGMAGPYLYYVRPFVPGTTLRAKLDKKGEMTLLGTVHLFRVLLEILDYAHSRGVHHGDLRPDNVLLSENSTAVAEFGLVSALVGSAREGAANRIGLALGDSRYLSPERVAGGGLPSGSDDIYAVGAMAYEMLAGDPPDPGSAPDPAVFRESIPSRLSDIVARCLEPDPGSRWRRPGEVLEALDRALGV
ncbi:Serine/threonine-protein kinase StkP [bacterium HR33]|nr:Serine/threonine-protein kinase StkP [bacterium HR33]